MLSSLKPLVMFLALAYSSGAPALDAVRPQVLDLPLRSFHEDVRLAAQNGLSGIRRLASAATVRSSIDAVPAAKLFRQVERDLRPATAGR